MRGCSSGTMSGLLVLIVGFVVILGILFVILGISRISLVVPMVFVAIFWVVLGRLIVGLCLVLGLVSYHLMTSLYIGEFYNILSE